MGWSDVHVAAEQLDLQRDDGLGDPDGSKDAAEDQRALVVSRIEAEEEGEKKAEQQWTPK